MSWLSVKVPWHSSVVFMHVSFVRPSSNTRVWAYLQDSNPQRLLLMIRKAVQHDMSRSESILQGVQDTHLRRQPGQKRWPSVHWTSTSKA